MVHLLYIYYYNNIIINKEINKIMSTSEYTKNYM